ncbi:MAG: aminoglycoside phosphotransferase family protein [Actinomyces sp.]|nr:MAG: aminoglycoside phosphotransferase family protein [Actinomyces sp.]
MEQSRRNPMAMARARHALTQAGLDPSVELVAASSVTNEVWLTPTHVVRVNRRPNQRLRREAILGPGLPAEIGYPLVVAYGGRLGADWLVVRRVPGEVLSRCWPSMSVAQRRDAIRQLAAKLRRLHRTPGPADLPRIDAPQMLRSDTLSPVMSLLVALDQARALDHVDRGLIDDAEQMVFDLTPAIEPFDGDYLIHGDLTFENILWDGERITAILDFEWARTAPNDLELDVLLRFCCFPQLHVAPDYRHETHARDYADVPWWLADDYPELFSHPRQLDRLLLYSIAYDVRDLMSAPPRSAVELDDPHHAVNRLRATVQRRSHLDMLDTAVV